MRECALHRNPELRIVLFSQNAFLLCSIARAVIEKIKLGQFEMVANHSGELYPRTPLNPHTSALELL